MPPIGINAIYEAAKRLDSDLCCMSWSGFNLAGDKASIDEVKRLQFEVERLTALLERRAQATISANDFDEQITEAIFTGIVTQAMPPLKEFYDEGYKAHQDGLPFHACKHISHSPKELSWRIGWNDRALKEGQ